MGYRRVFSTLGCGEYSLAESFQLAEAHGLDGVEVRSLAGSLDVPAALIAEFGTPEDLARWLTERKRRIYSLDTSLRLVGGTDEQRAEFLRFVPWAEHAGVPWLRVFDGGQSADAADIAAAAETFSWWQRQRQDNDWQTNVMIETHDSLFTAERIQRLVDAVPGVAILWDAHHTWKLGGEDPLATWRQIGRHVVHVHVKDSVSQPSGTHTYTYVLPGTGEFPAGPLLDILRREFSGCVSLEWERVWHPELPRLEEALQAAATHCWW